MKLVTMRFLTVTGIFIFFGLLFSACPKSENTNPIPSITYKSFGVGLNPDSAQLQVNFTDGDGDIGYPPQDASAPYDFYIQYWYCTDTLANSPAQVADSTFKPYPILNQHTHLFTDTLTDYYHIPYITPVGKDKSLTGIIEIALTGRGNGWYINYCVKTPSHNYFEYKVWIYDRAGHKSNILTTPILQGE